jgi:hypothetical protein
LHGHLALIALGRPAEKQPGTLRVDENGTASRAIAKGTVEHS